MSQRLQIRHESTRELQQERIIDEDDGPIENGLLSMQMADIDLNGAASSPAEEEDSTDTITIRTRRSRWSAQEPIECAPLAWTEPAYRAPNPAAYEIPFSKSTTKSPLRQNKTATPKAPRPHTIHVDGGGDVPLISSRPRTNSDSNEQDENKPPVSL